MAAETLRGEVPSIKVARRCGLTELSAALKARQLRWFGYVKKGGNKGALRKIREVEVVGQVPQGRPKKSWKKCVQEDLTSIGVDEEEAMNRISWRTVIKHLISLT